MKESSRSKKVAQEVSSDSDSEYSSKPVNNESDKRASNSNGLDVFEFDEYDGFEDTRFNKVVASAGRIKWNLTKHSGGKKKQVRNSGSKGSAVLTSRSGDKKKSEKNGGTKGSMALASQSGDKKASEKNGGTKGNAASMSKVVIDDDDSDEDEDEDDGFDVPLQVFTDKYRASSNKPVKLQEKNSVLKVKVDKDKKKDVASKTYHPPPEVEDRKDMKKLRKDDGDGESESGNKKKRETKSSTVDSNSKHADTTPLAESKGRSRRRGKVVRTQTQNVTPISKGKGNNVKNDTTTEKQILREKIKSMLLDAGWTIDYRPRKGRSYMDAVYITPTGTGYWSIVKAYDAFQKMEEDNSKDGEDFAPLPDDVLGKLMKQTQKKTERETNNKRKNEEADDDNTDEKNGRKSRKMGRGTLLVRGSDRGVNSENGFELYSGKRNILSWLIESEVVDMSEHVEYMNPRKTRVMQKGLITKDGIHCDCCSKIVTFSKFEEHSGSKLRDPFPNIFLKSRKSLMQCQIDAWDKLGELERKGFYNVDVDGDDPNDDTCGLCGDGGDLICCDGCPSTFHQSCLDIEMLPEGDWHCPNCTCKYCETVGGKTEDLLHMCCLCQKKYHESCRPEMDVKPIASDYLNLSFCGYKCHKIYSQLQKVIGVKHELDSELSWSFVRRSDLLTDAPSSVKPSQQVECNSMLAVSMSVMDECFLPVIDRKSGTNLIRNVVFNCGSNLSRLNYSRFFTAILEKGDEVVCAASIRIHGTQLAEMPFIGTRQICRRQGMCSRLLSAIESALSSLQVEKLLIPAVAEHMNTWTDVFGFCPLDESHKQEMKSLNILVFPRTDMLQKPLSKQDIVSKGNNTVEVDEVKAMSEKSERVSSDVKDCSEKIAATSSSSQEKTGDDGCSVDVRKESHTINSSDKDEMHVPLVVDANSSDLVSSIKIADDSNSNPSQILDVPSHDTISSLDIPCEPKLLVSENQLSEYNVEESTTPRATQVLDVPSHDTVSSSDIPYEPKLSVSANQLSESNVEESTTPLATEVLDVPSHDTVSSSDIPCEPKFSVSKDPLSESNVEESTTSEASEVPTALPSSNIIFSVIPCESEIQVKGKESVSINTESTTNVEENAVQNGDQTNVFPTQCLEKESVSSSVDVRMESMVKKVDLQNGCGNTTNVISLEEAQSPSKVASNNIASSDPPCEQESIPLDCHIPVKVKESSSDVILEIGIHAVKDNLLSEAKQASCESEMITQETV